LSCSLALAIARHLPGPGSEFAFKSIIAILAPASLVFLLGVYDDLHQVGPYTKFAVQGLAAIMLFAGGLRILQMPILFGSHHFPWFVGLPLTVIWVLAITNAFNLIDGLDGLPWSEPSPDSCGSISVLQPFSWETAGAYSLDSS
jgi:UDP-N-acetylmuramyl pentapeptide phosphotransferase/UDP-N-acetylglucosamine-1-phosphate transferase